MRERSGFGPWSANCVGLEICEFSLSREHLAVVSLVGLLDVD